MKTLYLHIGTPKTATTAIQNFCHDNEKILNEKSFCYPLLPYENVNVGLLRNAHFLLGYAFDENKNRDLEKEDMIFSEGFEKIYELFEQYDNIILSDEAIWNAGLREDDELFWKRLKKELDKQKFQIKILVYVRRQDEFIYSWWNQKIKEGMFESSLRSWEETVELLPVIHTHYYESLERIAEYVGKDNIIVRIFDRAKMSGGSIYTDFLEAIGLEYTDEYEVLTEIRNVSFTKNACEIKRNLNVIPNLDSKSNIYFRRILSRISKEHGEDKDYNMFSNEELKDFLSHYEEENRMLAKEYLGIEEELFSKEKEVKKWDCVTPEMLQDIVQFFGTVSVRLLQENETLKKEMKELKSQNKKTNRFMQKIKSFLTFRA